jgi:hypothetical protein
MNLKPLPDYGTLIPIKEFIDQCLCFAFIDYDGHGNYATETQMSDIIVSPSDIVSSNGKYHEEFSHVMWFNR